MAEKKLLRVLIVEDSEDDVLLLLRVLRRGGYEPVYEQVWTEHAMTKKLETREWDLIICNYALPTFNGLAALKQIKEKVYDLPFIILSDRISEEIAVEAMKAGANDYIFKGNMDRLIPAINRELRGAEMRKQLEAEIQTSRVSYSTVFNHAIIGMAVLDVEGRVLESNPALQKMLGYSGAELKGRAFTEVSHPDDIKKDLDLFRDLLAEKRERYQLEKRYVRKDGKLLWAKVSASVVRSPRGVPVLIIRMVEDITARKQAEKELDNFFDLSLDMLCILDNKGYFRRINPSFQKTLGYTGAELLEKRITDFVHPDDLEKIKGFAHHLNTREPAVKFNHRCLCKDGSIKWLEWTAVHDPAQGLIYAVARDVTAQKLLEKEMIRLERLNLVGEMAAGISHEVRNPMTTIRGFLQLLSGKEECSQYKSYYDLMIEELDRANSIITEFLSLGRSKETELEMQNLNDIINTLLPLIQADAMRMDKYIDTRLADVPDLMLNAKELRQLILNLARNGLEAMPRNGVVTISTYTAGQEVCLEVRDQGKGMTLEVMEKLGTPFFTTKEQGTGLGMAVCYGIAARHNARIEVTSGSGGTTFVVRFPAG
ncbi:hybrid sensor histidine kinase/response regulator [Desulfotruncus alcoholivorax]|uniref:hybrid sensor histidine kinase/response regulator n=1 Tax=Desulfotruncus alcoholivorax TaxID=265477 RepID=UPI0003FA0246|nr:hybrid sensor histidine kinase/response regulator [Desulfotruncus alcoholivorax]